MKLSIIIPTKDRPDIFRQTIHVVVEASKHLQSEIVVVNDSLKGVPDLPNDTRIKLVQNPRQGVAAARNFGFTQTTGDVLLFMDDDILVSAKTLDHVMDLHSRHENACFNLNWEYTPETLEKISRHPFSRFLHRNGMTSFKGWYNDNSWKDNALFPSRSVASFHLSIRRADFQRSGGYDEKFPFAGFEDYDFPLRLKRIGLQFYIDTRIRVYHNEVDRLDLDNWLASQERRAVTRRKAVMLGYKELALVYRAPKKFILRSICRFELVLKKSLGLIPNLKFMDPLYFGMVSALQASRIYKGYMRS